MRLSFANDRVLAVVAHPDDAELLCAGTLARARNEGAQVGLVVCCLGDKGQPRVAIDDLAKVRARELRQSVEMLGAELFHGDVPDGTLINHVAARLWMVNLLRTFRPTLVLAHCAEDYHPDHQAVAALAEAATWQSASRGLLPDVSPLDEPPELWFMDTVGMQRFSPGFFVDVSPYRELKERMLACHASQLARSGDHEFSPLMDVMHRQSETRGAQSGVAAAEAFRICDTFKRARAW